MENYALIARQEEQIKALKTENDYLKKVRNPTEIENANLRQKNDALELENKSLQSEIQVMTEKHNLKVEELESDLEVAELDVESAKSRNLEFNRREKFRLRKMACISVVVVLLVSVVIYGLGHSNGYKNASNYLQKSSNKILNAISRFGLGNFHFPTFNLTSPL